VKQPAEPVEAAAKTLRDKPDNRQALKEPKAAVGRLRKAKSSDAKWAGGA
jgi:hypothetical protein